MCRIFFPRINFLFLTFFIFDSFFVRAKFRPPLLLNNTFIIILKSVVRRRTTEQNSLRREARNALEEH